MLRQNTETDGGWFLVCDGCGKEILAQVFDDRIVVTDRRHGSKHIAVIHRCDLLNIMGACVNPSNNKKESD